jgi:hypothetical protein
MGTAPRPLLPSTPTWAVAAPLGIVALHLLILCHRATTPLRPTAPRPLHHRRSTPMVAAPRARRGRSMAPLQHLAVHPLLPRPTTRGRGPSTCTPWARASSDRVPARHLLVPRCTASWHPCKQRHPLLATFTLLPRTATPLHQPHRTATPLPQPLRTPPLHHGMQPPSSTTSTP